MKTYNISSTADQETMEHENFPTNSLVSYAQQVSFPNWNTMVGDLRQKFARRSSFERETTNCKDGDVNSSPIHVEDVTNFLPKKCKSSEKIDEQQNCRSVDETTQMTGTASCKNREYSNGEVSNNENHGVSREISKCNEKLLRSRKPIIRYCEIIKEDSQESDEQENKKENQTPSKIHISSVSIMLKSTKGRKKEENQQCSKNDQNETLIVGNENKEEMNNEEIIETDKDDKERNEKNDKESNEKDDKGEMKQTPNEIIFEDMGKNYLQQQTNECEEERLKINDELKTDENNDKIELEESVNKTDSMKGVDKLRSCQKSHLWRTRRTGAVDEGILSPDHATTTDKELSQQKHQFRKKSSSFSGNLPLNFQTDKEKSSLLSADLNKSKILQRRRGTVDMGRVDPQRSPMLNKEHHHHHNNNNHDRKVDPSHYLMHGGKRRGSFNPTYNQFSTTMQKNRKNNAARAKSLFICQTDERDALRERLMKHACPELRHSIERDDTEDENGEKNEMIKDSKETKAAQRRPLRKSISFDSKPEVLENAQEIAEFYEKLKNCGQSRMTNRKAGIIPSPTTRSSEYRTKIIASTEVETTIFTNNVGMFGESRFSRQTGRHTRALSSFAGVPSMDLGRLKEKSMDHGAVIRSKSDSLSSASSSEGGESVDPFPMHTAVKAGRQKKLQQLISKGMDVNANDNDGWPPIHYALSSGNFEIVAFLLKAGANISDYTKGRTSKYFK